MHWGPWQGQGAGLPSAVGVELLQVYIPSSDMPQH